MAELFANSGDPDQMPHFVASDQGLHSLPITPLGFPNYNGLKMLGLPKNGTDRPKQMMYTLIKINTAGM